jgi:hypothetical protein
MTVDIAKLLALLPANARDCPSNSATFGPIRQLPQAVDNSLGCTQPFDWRWYPFGAGRCFAHAFEVTRTRHFS